MLSLDDPRWPEMKAGYRLPFDVRPLTAKIEAGADVDETWHQLWEELCHQGDVGEGSYAAVPPLVRIHRQRGTADWNVYGLVATIELARDSRKSPPLPDWLEEGYHRALQDLAEQGHAELPLAKRWRERRCILAILALTSGARVYGRILLEFSEAEILDLERQAFGERE